MKKVINFITLLSFIVCTCMYPLVAAADEEVATIRVGEPAPFTGTLFNTEATARMLAELQLSEESCAIQINRAVEFKEAELILQIDQIQASLEAQNLRYDQTLQIKNDHIDFLDKQVTRNRISPAWTFIGGVILGSAIAIGSGAAINHVSSN
jgi:hypothetical protein